jgi:predicted MFS family arabinose efflux permease
VTFTIVLLSLAAFASAASMRVTDAMLPRLADDFHVGLAQAAGVITAFAVAYGVMQMLFGALGDRFGKLRVIALAAIGASAATFVCLAANGYPMFIAGRALSGALCGAIIPLAMAWIGDVVPYAERQPVIARFLLGQILGLGGGTAVGGFAAEQEHWRWPFAVLAVWLLLSGGSLLRAARRHPRPHPATRSNFFRDLARVFRSRWARAVIATVSLEGVVVFGALAFVPTHLHYARGFTLSHAGLAMLMFAVGGVGFAIFARPVVRALGEVGLALIGSVLLSGGLALAAWTPFAAMAPAGCLLAGLGFYMLHNTLQTNATQMAPERRGAGMALFASTFFLGQAAGVAIAGVLAQRLGALLVIAGAAVAILPIGLNFARLRRGMK